MFAGYVPWRYFGLAQTRLDLGRPMTLLGLLCTVAGAWLLATCIWEFARSGRGTLAPVDPPRKLVVRGLYRYVRNPMYLSVTAIVPGEGLLVRSWALLLYWAVWFVGANLFVIGYEEPALRRRCGDASATGTSSTRGGWGAGSPWFRRALWHLQGNHDRTPRELVRLRRDTLLALFVALPPPPRQQYLPDEGQDAERAEP